MPFSAVTEPLAEVYVKKGWRRHPVLLLGATGSTILSVILAALSGFSPETVNRVSNGVLGPVVDGGPIREEYVGGQIAIFLFASALTVLLVGWGWAGLKLYHSSQVARAIAAGRDLQGWLVYVLGTFMALMPILLGIFLPRSIFQPTNLEALQEKFAPAAWAVHSLLGGLIVGIVLSVLSWGFGLGLQSLHAFARSVRQRRFHRIMENS